MTEMEYEITAGSPGGGACVVEAITPGGHGAQYRGWYDGRRRMWRLYAMAGSYLPAGQPRMLTVPAERVRYAAHPTAPTPAREPERGMKKCEAGAAEQMKLE